MSPSSRCHELRPNNEYRLLVLSDQNCFNIECHELHPVLLKASCTYFTNTVANCRFRGTLQALCNILRKLMVNWNKKKWHILSTQLRSQNNKPSAIRYVLTEQPLRVLTCVVTTYQVCFELKTSKPSFWSP